MSTSAMERDAKKAQFIQRFKRLTPWEQSCLYVALTELLEDPQVTAGQRYSHGNAPGSDTAYQDMAQGLRTLYGVLGSWAAVGAEVGLTKAYAWRVAHGELMPSAQALAKWRAYRGQVAQV